MNKKTLFLVFLSVFIFIVSAFFIFRFKVQNSKLNLEAKRLENDLNYSNRQIDSLENEVSDLNKKKANLQNNLSNVNVKLENQKWKVKSLKSNLERINESMQNIKESNLQTIVSDKKLAEFLESNQVDEHDYIYDNNEVVSSDEYVCSDYTSELIRDAKQEGIFMCETTLYYYDIDYSHAVVSVNTSSGVKYIEPQSDDIYNSLEVGDSYSGHIISKIVSCYNR